MKKVKFLAVALAAVLLLTFSMSTITSVFAKGDEPQIIVSEATAKAGDEKTVTISLANNPGICTLCIDVAYDSALTLVSATDSKLLVGAVFGGDKTANPYRLTWDDSLADENNAGNGTIVTLKFKVADDATEGDKAVTVTYNEDEIYNLDIDLINFSVVNGKITVVSCLHENTTNYPAVASTCKVAGHAAYTKCDDCGAIISGDDTPLALASHSFTNYVSDGNATCTADGTKTAKCDNCDATDTITDTGSKLPHSFTNYVSNNDATCTADGTKTAKCDNCDATDTKADVGSKLPHSFTNYVSNNDATCTADGTKTAKCDNCDATNTITDTGSKLPHSFTNYVSNNDATCEDNCTETAKCDNCDATDTRVIPDTALNHSFTNYVSDDNATCEGNCTETAKCDRCDATDTREIPDTALGHNYEYKVTKEPTTKEEGLKEEICTRCGNKTGKSEPIPMLKDLSVEDGDQALDIKDNNAVVFKTNIKKDRFSGIKIDGIELEDQDYELGEDEDGNTVLTLTDAGKAKLAAKNGDVAVQILGTDEDGNPAAAEYTLTVTNTQPSATDDTNTETGTKTDTEAKTDDTKTAPKTDDSDIAFLVIALVALMGMSVSTGIVYRKKRNNK